MFKIHKLSMWTHSHKLKWKPLMLQGIPYIFNAISSNSYILSDTVKSSSQMLPTWILSLTPPPYPGWRLLMPYEGKYWGICKWAFSNGAQGSAGHVDVPAWSLSTIMCFSWSPQAQLLVHMWAQMKVNQMLAWHLSWLTFSNGYWVNIIVNIF